jgi:hypothetical protein
MALARGKSHRQGKSVRPQALSEGAHHLFTAKFSVPKPLACLGSQGVHLPTVGHSLWDGREPSVEVVRLVRDDVPVQQTLVDHVSVVPSVDRCQQRPVGERVSLLRYVGRVPRSKVPSVVGVELPIICS